MIFEDRVDVGLDTTRARANEKVVAPNAIAPNAIAPVVKPTNPKDAMGVKKYAMSCVSAPVMAYLSLAMLEGALKYGRHNYRPMGVRGSVYYDAAKRHLEAWWEGQDFDPESKVGLHHIDKAIASLVVLRDSMIQENFTDDRPPKSPEGWIDDVNKKAEHLVAAFPDPKPPFTAR